MMDYDTYEATRNDVDALLKLASQMHHLAATSDLREVCVQSLCGAGETVYDGTSVALKALLALKWPGVNVEWLYDLWIDTMPDVPTQADVESCVLNNLYRAQETDPSSIAARAVDEAMYGKYGQDAYATASWTEARAAEANAVEKRVYAEATRQVEALAKEMAAPRTENA